MRLPFLGCAVALLLPACSGGSFGSVEAGKVELEGQVDQEYFVRQLDQLDPWFEACYARALRRDRQTQGVILMRLRGDSSHLIPEVIRNETGSDELAECVTHAIATLGLVTPEGSAPWDFTVEWPITFNIVRRS